MFGIRDDTIERSGSFFRLLLVRLFGLFRPFDTFDLLHLRGTLGSLRALGPLTGRQQGIDYGEQRVVLVALADRDADVVGQAGLVEVSVEDALLLPPSV